MTEQKYKPEYPRHFALECWVIPADAINLVAADSDGFPWHNLGVVAEISETKNVWVKRIELA
jgi:hypothetical protein